MTHKLLSALFIIVFSFSCTINDRDFQIKGVQANPTMVLPFASGDLSIIDILSKQDSSNVKVASDGVVYLDYNATLFTFNDIRKLVDIPNIGNIDNSLAIPAVTYPADKPDQTVATHSQPVNMGISPEKLTEIAFKSGSLSYSVGLSQPANKLKYSILISIPEFVSNSTGNGFAQEVIGSTTGSLPLSDYMFKSATANFFTLNLALVIKNNDKSATVSPGTNLNVTISFAGMDFKYIYGFFGDQIANPPAQVISLPAYTTSFQNGASVSFAQPKMDLDVISEYGVPLTVTFSYVNAGKLASTMAILTSPASSSAIPITAPTTFGTSATTPVTVTNAKALFDFAPTSFGYKVSGHINTGLTSGNDFMADTSSVKVNMHTQIPLYGKASNIILMDTMDIDLGDTDQSKIDSASLKVYTANELPLDANLQLILTDDSGVFIDSLLTSAQASSLIKGSTVDANGELVTAGTVNKFIPLQLDKISKIFKAKKVIMRAKLNTVKDASGTAVDVKFKSQYKIAVKLGLKATIKLKTTF